MQFIRYDFSSFAKACSDRALLWTALGKPFQTRGAAAAKEQSPKDVFILTIQTVKSAPGAVHMRMHVSTLAYRQNCTSSIFHRAAAAAAAALTRTRRSERLMNDEWKRTIEHDIVYCCCFGPRPPATSTHANNQYCTRLIRNNELVTLVR